MSYSSFKFKKKQKEEKNCITKTVEGIEGGAGLSIWNGEAEHYLKKLFLITWAQTAYRTSKKKKRIII